MKLPFNQVVRRTAKKLRHNLQSPNIDKQLAPPNAKMHFIDANDFLCSVAVEFNCVDLDEYLEVRETLKANLRK